jgi:hypothetical protein
MATALCQEIAETQDHGMPAPAAIREPSDLAWGLTVVGIAVSIMLALTLIVLMVAA